MNATPARFADLSALACLRCDAERMYSCLRHLVDGNGDFPFVDVHEGTNRLMQKLARRGLVRLNERRGMWEMRAAGWTFMVEAVQRQAYEAHMAECRRA